MPRGFLVKRSKRVSAASYRMRNEDRETPKSDPSTQSTDGPTSVLVACPNVAVSETVRECWTSAPTKTSQPHVPEGSADMENSLEHGDYAHHFSDPEQSESPCNSDISYSPIKPVSVELKRSFFDRCLSSPATAESFPLSTPVSSIERLLMNHAEMKFDSPVNTYTSFHQSIKRSYMETERKSKPSGKKPKVMRKLNFEDEVTTSPVLGLKIKKESPESKEGPSSTSGKKKPLGEFICQLCKLEYPDPFSLAQHKCSRIVRVEYRCPECDKVFSCPANLASHRRWHKPRNLNNSESQSMKKSQLVGRIPEKTSMEGKENTNKIMVNNQHHLTLDSSQCHRPTDSIHGEEQLRTRSQDSPPPPLDQRYMSTEKCFDLHIRSADNSRLFEHCSEATDVSTSAYLPSPGGGEEVYECHYCSKKFRRQAYLRKHLAAHETIKSPPYNQIESGQITFPCHLCGAHFPSAEIRDKHRLWHAVRDDIFVNPGKSASALMRPDLSTGDQQIFSCKHCPSTFFSSPGLTRHINKSHPTENRQVMLLQMPVRPGC
ncbi:insulinoma-associated protein 1 [Chanos chanos]|uniref:Insulinoma-associated protein 2 n=1 Tax=Chanos chanos TaxID=29144 RepID=A0A6J2WJG5_CHACN|nr:insulinoma-associated protein 2 [Chanos chanos]